MTMIRNLILRWRNNRKISRASKAAILLSLSLAAPASANPSPQGQELTIYPGGSARARGYAYGSERTDARLFYYGAWHNWSACYRSTWSVHLWVCSGIGAVPPGNGGYAEIAYHNSNGWSYGFTPWVLSSCCSTNTATSGVIG